MKALIAALSIATVAIPVALAAHLHTLEQPAQAQPSAWQLVQFYKGDAFIIDHGMTHDDCDDAIPHNQAAKGLTFACELER